jgi:hypothetical protein
MVLSAECEEKDGAAHRTRERELKIEDLKFKSGR